MMRCVGRCMHRSGERTRKENTGHARSDHAVVLVREVARVAHGEHEAHSRSEQANEAANEHL